MNKEGVLYWTNGWNWHSLDNPNRFPMSDIDMYRSCVASVTILLLKIALYTYLSSEEDTELRESKFELLIRNLLVGKL